MTTLKEEVVLVTDKLEKLFERARKARDGAVGDEKKILRKITRGIDNAFDILVDVEELAEESL